MPKHAVYAVLNTGQALNLTGITTQLTRSDMENELAQRANLTIANIKSAQGLMSNLIRLCTQIVIKADGANVFGGTVWDWEPSASSKEKTLTVLAYDKLIYAQKSKDYGYFQAGRTTESIIQEICGNWGIPCVYGWESITHAKIAYKGISIGEQIQKTLNDAKTKIKGGYVVRMTNDRLYVLPEGANSQVPGFSSATNLISVRSKMTLNGIVTKVIVVGKEDKDGRPRVEATVTGNTAFGTLQDILVRDGDATLETATAEAQTTIDENGTPKERVDFEGPDVASLRKGDRISIRSDAVNGIYVFKSITHNAVDHTMNGELERMT